MPIRVSEKKLIVGILFFMFSLYTLYAVKLIAMPVYVSEKGVLIAFAAILLMYIGAKLFKGAVKEV